MLTTGALSNVPVVLKQEHLISKNAQLKLWINAELQLWISFGFVIEEVSQGENVLLLCQLPECGPENHVQKDMLKRSESKVN